MVWGIDTADNGWYGPSGSVDWSTYDELDYNFSIQDVITTTFTVVSPGQAKVVYLSPPSSPYSSAEHSRSSSLDGSDGSPTSETPPSDTLSTVSDGPRTPEPGEEPCFADVMAVAQSPPPIPERLSSHKLNRYKVIPPRIYTDIKPFAGRKSAHSPQNFGPDYFGEESWADSHVPKLANAFSIDKTMAPLEPESPRKSMHKRALSLRPLLTSSSGFLRS